MPVRFRRSPPFFMHEINCNKHGNTNAYKSKNRFRCKKCNVEAVTKRRKYIKEKAIEYKGGSCVNCGYKKCVEAFEFHHLDPKQKDFAISKNGHSRSWDKVKKELDKCIILCANCHRELHSKLNSEVS